MNLTVGRGNREMVRVKFSVLLTVVLWLALFSLGIALQVALMVSPERVLYLVDVDRQVRVIPSSYVASSRLIVWAVLITLLGSMMYGLSNRQRASDAIDWLYGRSADQFFARVSSDIRCWATTWESRVHLITLVALLGMGFLFRYYPLQLPVSYDESISLVWFSSRSWIDVISDYTIPNNHILYNVFTNLLVHAFGITPTIIRVPALLAGLLVIPVSYWLIRRILNERAALMTAGLAAAAPLVVEYSAQGRGYTLFWLFFLMAFIVATYLRDQPSRFGWGLFVLVVTLGMYTMPVMLFGVGVIAFWMLLASPKQRIGHLIVELTVAGFGVIAATLLAYLPAIMRTHSTSLFRGTVDEVSAYPLMLKNWLSGLPLVVIGLFTLGIVIALLQAGGVRRQAFNLLAAGLLAHLAFAVMGAYAPARVLNYQFLVISSIASFGLVLLYERARIFKGPQASYVWAGLVIIVAVYWGSVRLYDTRPMFDANGVSWVDGKAPGAEGVNCCAEGYFVDAEPIVSDWAQHLKSGDAIAAQWDSGTVETMRFYLMEANRSPVLIHPYTAQKGLEQLAPYNQVYVLVKLPPESGVDRLAESNPGEVVDLLGVSPSDLEEVYFPPRLVASYRVSKLYYLPRRVPLGHDTAETENVPFNMFWAW